MPQQNPYSPSRHSNEESNVSDRHPLRLVSVIALACLVGMIPLHSHLLLIVLAFAVLNSAATLPLMLAASPKLGLIAFASSIIFLATLLNSNWGFSTPNPVVRLTWVTFGPAVLLMVCWMGYPLLPANLRIALR